MNKQRIVLAGGSGFLGGALVKELLLRNYSVVVLTRAPRGRKDGVLEVQWDGRHVGEWIKFVDHAGAVVNLAGRSVNCRHTPENLREITESRVNSVRTIAAAMEHVAAPPRVWVQTSSLAFYGDLNDQWCDEGTPAGPGLLSETCRLWEGACQSAILPRTRRVLLRIGLVLGRNGGVLKALSRLARWGLGGAAGSGSQYMSWIHIADADRMFIEAIEHEDLKGVFNATGPNPVTNREFMDGLRRALHRPWSPPVPEWAVRFGAWLMQTDPGLALTGRRCRPARFLQAGFKFRFPDLSGALNNIC